jgi:hypothetical protein
VSDEILMTLQQEVAKHCNNSNHIRGDIEDDGRLDSIGISRKIPVVFTSSQSRLGGVELLMKIVNSCM